MRFLKRALINTSKEEIIVNFSGICFCLFLRIFNIFPILFYDVVSLSIASAATIYFTFYSKSKDKISINNRLIGAIVTGMIIWMMIEAYSKLFAKWAVCSFF